MPFGYARDDKRRSRVPDYSPGTSKPAPAGEILRPIQAAVTMILRERRGRPAMTYNDSRQVLM